MDTVRISVNAQQGLRSSYWKRRKDAARVVLRVHRVETNPISNRNNSVHSLHIPKGIRGLLHEGLEYALNIGPRIHAEPANVRVPWEGLSLDENHFVHTQRAHVGDSNVSRKSPWGFNKCFPLGTKTIAQWEVVVEDIRPQVIDPLLIRVIRRVYLGEVRRNNRKRPVTCLWLRHIDSDLTFCNRRTSFCTQSSSSNDTV